jgi:hypothetical protein
MTTKNTKGLYIMNINMLTARQTDTKEMIFSVGIDTDQTEITLYFDLEELDSQTIEELEEDWDLFIQDEEIMSEEPIQAYKLHNEVVGSITFQVEEVEVK